MASFKDLNSVIFRTAAYGKKGRVDAGEQDSAEKHAQNRHRANPVRENSLIYR
jgi:hypothetical protein